MPRGDGELGYCLLLNGSANSVLETRHTQMGCVGVAVGEALHCGELLMRCRKAGFETGDLTEPAVLAGLVDAVLKVATSELGVNVIEEDF